MMIMLNDGDCDGGDCDFKDYDYLWLLKDYDQQQPDFNDNVDNNNPRREFSKIAKRPNEIQLASSLEVPG